MSKPSPDDRLFSEEHEWVKIDGNNAVMGVTDYAQASLGDVVYVELPDIGSNIKQGAAIGVVESVKAVSDLFAPLSGLVKAVNQAVVDKPETINKDPYGEGWLLMVELSNPKEVQSLLNPKAYQDMLSQEAK